MGSNKSMIKSGLRGGLKISVDSGSDAWVLSTSGSIQNQISRPSSSSIDMPPPESYGSSAPIRSEFLTGRGTETYSGSASFDMTESVMPIMMDLASFRGMTFKVEFAIPEENSSYSLQKCYMQSLSMSGSANGIITGSLSFISVSKWRKLGEETASHKSIMAKMTGIVTSQDRYEQPMAYWYSGGTANEDLKDWTFNVSQDAKPVFGNTPGTLPLYIRCGNMKYELSVTSYMKIEKPKAININGSVFALHGVTSSEGVNFAPGEPVSASHVFTGYSTLSEGSKGVVFELNSF